MSEQNGQHFTTIDPDDLDRLQELDEYQEVSTFKAKKEIEVHSYEELADWFRAFGQAKKVDPKEVKVSEGESYAEALARASEDEIGFFAIVGPPGTGKTEHMKGAVSDGTLYIEGGRVSPLGLYTELYKHRNDKKVVIDDAESILKETDGRNLAKGLCQTKRVKSLSWKTHSKVLKELEVPNSYEVTASLGLITNDMTLLEDKKIAPLISRGVLILFTPSKYEIHDYTKKWFIDPNPDDEVSKKIFDFFGRNLDVIGTQDMRLYYTARVMARRSQDWERFLKERLLGWDSKELLAEKLMKDPSFPSNLDRFKAWHRKTGKSLRTFNTILTERKLRGIKPDPAPAAVLVVEEMTPEILDTTPQDEESTTEIQAPTSEIVEPAPEIEAVREKSIPEVEEDPTVESFFIPLDPADFGMKASRALEVEEDEGDGEEADDTRVVDLEVHQIPDSDRPKKRKSSAAGRARMAKTGSR